jgi:hypothetical protein
MWISDAPDATAYSRMRVSRSAAEASSLVFVAGLRGFSRSLVEQLTEVAPIQEVRTVNDGRLCQMRLNLLAGQPLQVGDRLTVAGIRHGDGQPSTGDGKTDQHVRPGEVFLD